MQFRDLILPDGGIMLYATGKVIEREPRLSDMPWDELSGKTLPRSGQPFAGCPTGADIVAERLMHLLRQP